jgi:hypothetical protein
MNGLSEKTEKVISCMNAINSAVTPYSFEVWTESILLLAMQLEKAGFSLKIVEKEPTI